MTRAAGGGGPDAAGRAVLYAKLGVSLVEVLAGAALVALAVTHLDLAAALHRAAVRELHEDPGDVVAHHVVGLRARGLHPAGERAVGLALLAYGGVKAGLVLAILRGARRLVPVGASVFVALAAVGLVVLARHPTPLRALLGLLDLAVAVVVVREAGRAVRG